jgi:hypothetical protein
VTGWRARAARWEDEAAQFWDHDLLRLQWEHRQWVRARPWHQQLVGVGVMRCPVPRLTEIQPRDQRSASAYLRRVWVLNLRHEGVTYTEIGRRLGCSMSWAREVARQAEHDSRMPDALRPAQGRDWRV